MLHISFISTRSTCRLRTHCPSSLPRAAARSTDPAATMRFSRHRYDANATADELAASGSSRSDPEQLILPNSAEKIITLKDAAQRLGPALPSAGSQAQPDADDVGADPACRRGSRQAAGERDGASADATARADYFSVCSGGAASASGPSDLVPPLDYDLDRLRKSLPPNRSRQNPCPISGARLGACRRQSPRSGAAQG